ncbi:hypothetical protein [Streptomyces misionensis]|uniref:hypothetical protein n=1 Tax=Streptomyces misionensis TaxID=67331 RepID=UPI0036A9FA03
MERAHERPVGREPVTDGPGRTAESVAGLELLVHGVGGTTPEKMLGDARTVRITGDDTAAVFRRAEDVAPATGPDGGTPARSRGEPVQEAYVWCNLTSGDSGRALWLLLLPFMVVNLAHWMRPAAPDRPRTVRLYGLLVRLIAFTLTLLLVAAACEVALDLAAWQCAGAPACASRHFWLAFLTPDTAEGAGVRRWAELLGASGGWWAQPGRRLALAALVPGALVALLWYLAHRTWNAYESHRPLVQVPESAPEPGGSALARPGFWYGRRLVARLRAAHTAAGLLTVAAALVTPAARFDHRPGGPAALDALSWLLTALLLAGALAAVAVVCRRGRDEDQLDQRLDRHLVRLLPLATLVLLALAVLYTGWSRPGWRSAGRLPGDPVFGALMLAQGMLVVALGVVARGLYRRTADGRRHLAPQDRRHPDAARTCMRGLGGPATALLACALGGVMSGGVAQRVADWLDGDGGSLAGPPVLLTWQASVIPPVIVVLLALAGRLLAGAGRTARAERARVNREYAGEPEDPARTRAIAHTRAMAALTDRAPLVLGVLSVTTLVLGGAALAGALLTGKTPDGAARGTADAVRIAAAVCQGLGSWLVGLGFLLFVTWGRRAYKDAGARRTVGILWDVGTFWPRAAHPFAPPCYAERAVPDLTWRMATWTRATGGRLVLSGHSQGTVLAAAAAWQLSPATRGRIALLTYGSPLERLYGRWFPAHFGPAALAGLHRDIACWSNLYRRTDPIGGPVRIADDGRPPVDHEPLRDPLAYGRTPEHPLPGPILGHSDYQADPVFARVRADLLARLSADLPAPRPEPGARSDGNGRQGSSGRSSG